MTGRPRRATRIFKSVRAFLDCHRRGDRRAVGERRGSRRASVTDELSLRLRRADDQRRCSRARSGWIAIATIAVATGPPTSQPAAAITAKYTSVMNAATSVASTSVSRS